MKQKDEQRLQQVKDLAQRTYALLEARTAIPANLQAELEEVVQHHLPLPLPGKVHAESKELDRLGSKIWTAASQLEQPRADDVEDEQHHHGSLLRVFAFSLIDAARPAPFSNTAGRECLARIFKIALKTGRVCLDTEKIDVALRILQRCSDYVRAVEDDAPILQTAKRLSAKQTNQLLTLGRHAVEYYLLRMLHAAKTSSQEMIVHFYTKINQQELATLAPLLETIAEVLHNIAKIWEAREVWGLTTTWCQRALAALDHVGKEQLTGYAAELALAISSTGVGAYLRDGSPQSFTKADRLVERLENTGTTHYQPGPDVLRFQILCASRPPVVAKVEDVVFRMIKDSLLTDGSFDTIMRVLQKFKHFNTISAMASIHILIISRLLPECRKNPNEDIAQERLDRAIVDLTLTATTKVSRETSSEVAARLQTVFDEVHRAHGLGLSGPAAAATQIALWRKAKTLCTRLAAEQEDTSVDAWIALLQHPLLDNGGPSNRGKIGRTVLLTRLNRQDAGGARAAFYAMPESNQDDMLSRFLAFKLALADGDQVLAQESLRFIAKHAKEDTLPLYACVLTAQLQGPTEISSMALKILLDLQPPGIHFPSLLRCTTCLMLREFESPDQDMDKGKIAEELVVLFERAVKNTGALRDGTDEDWHNEVLWWSKTAYNLALKQGEFITPEMLIRMLAVRLRFLDCFPQDHQAGLRHRRLHCHFTSATSCMSIAKGSEEGSTQRRQAYMQARTQIAQFKNHYREWQRTMDATMPAADRLNEGKLMGERAFQLMRDDLECILYLQLWSELDATVTSLLDFTGSGRWENLTDLMLTLNQHARTSFEIDEASRGRIRDLLATSVNETWKRNKDINKMSHWLRQSFAIHLDDSDEEFALNLVQQATSIAAKGYNGRTDPYPSDELNWLAGTVFNQGVEFLNRGEDEKAETWVAESLELARYADDNGSLHANLTRRKQYLEDRLVQERPSKRRRVE